jgi:hypothetical protein
MSKRTRQYVEAQLGEFLRLYGRKAQKGCEPNDRRYDREIEVYLKRLRPEELDVLLNGEEDERLPSSRAK